jgi:hypothetical protein
MSSRQPSSHISSAPILHVTIVHVGGVVGVGVVGVAVLGDYLSAFAHVIQDFLAYYMQKLNYWLNLPK